MADTLSRQVDIAIVGGGIAGLAAAAALSQQGLSLLLIESRPLPSSLEAGDDSVHGFDPRVSALTPRSIAFLTRLGAWAAVEGRRHCPYTHMSVWDAEGTGSIDFDAAGCGAAMLGSIVENRLLTAALAQQLAARAGLHIAAPATLAEAQRGDGGVDLTLNGGERWQCGLLIAADGARSPTRERFGFRTREWDYGHRAIVTTARFAQPHRHTAWQRFLPTGPLALLPLPGAGERLCSIVWSIEEARADELLAMDDAAFAQALSAASERRLGAVEACAPRFAFPLRQRHAVDYVQAGVALVADAAHTIHPLAGQGINLGLADVEVLVDEIARAQCLALRPGSMDVLRRYQRRRKGDNLAMMAAMDGFKGLFGSDAPPLRWLRNEGLRRVDAMAPLKRRIIRHAMGIGAPR
jgi:2-octaprenylphenol hydroxylase